MLAKHKALFDLVESEADVRIYMDREGFKAEGAGIVITSSPVGHRPKERGDKFTLWFGQGISRETFKNLKEASLRALEILDTANRPITPRVEGPRSRTFLKVLKKEGRSLSNKRAHRGGEIC